MLVPKTFSEIFGALKEQLCSTRHILSFSMSVLISSFLGISFSVSLSLSTSMSDHYLFFFFLLRMEELVMFCLHGVEYVLACSDSTTVYF